MGFQCQLYMYIYIYFWWPVETNSDKLRATKHHWLTWSPPVSPSWFWKKDMFLPSPGLNYPPKLHFSLSKGLLIKALLRQTNGYSNWPEIRPSFLGGSGIGWTVGGVASPLDFSANFCKVFAVEAGGCYCRFSMAAFPIEVAFFFASRLQRQRLFIDGFAEASNCNQTGYLNKNRLVQ